MRPEDQLDVLLSRQQAGNVRDETFERPQHNGQPGSRTDDEMEHLTTLDTFAPPLEAADRLKALRKLEPTAAFARTLEERVLWYATQVDDAITTPSILIPQTEADDLAWNFERTIADAQPLAGGARARRHRRLRVTRVFVPAAAALALVLLTSVLAAATLAGPGAALYGLHRWEQSVRVDLADSPADQTRLHLQYARDALHSLDQAARKPVDEDAYHDALSALDTELASATRSLSGVPAGQTRDTLGASMDVLRAQARQDMYAALPALNWADRVRATSVLGHVGAVVPVVSQATIEQFDHDGAMIWYCTVNGSGFAPNAVLVVNGQQVGAVVSVTSDMLVAEMTSYGEEPSLQSVGVSNVDGTAAMTTTIAIHSADGNDHAPSATATTSDDHGGSGQGGDGGSDGGHGGSSGSSGSGGSGGSSGG